MTATSNAETVTISRAEYEEFQAQRERISALEKQVEALMEAIRLARQKRFGASSEHIGDDGMEQLSLLFDEAEVHAAQAAKEPNFIPGSFAAPEAVAHLLTQKFVMGSPLYRQELYVAVPHRRKGQPTAPFCLTSGKAFTYLKDSVALLAELFEGRTPGVEQ